MSELQIKYVTDKDGNRVLPVTHLDAVRDNNGNTLTSLMSPENLGNGIGICSTSSGTALVVALSGYNLVKNGFVAVTFENDVPANATLNINSKGAKPIYYKGSAIEADTIKADDTVMFAYDGTNYVITSLGGEVNALPEVEIGETAPTGTPKLFVDEDADPAASFDVYTRTQTDTMLAAKADKTATVSEVTYDSSANMLKQTINGVTTDITQVVQSGFVPQFNATTGIMELNPVGGATISPNATTGIIEMTF